MHPAGQMASHTIRVELAGGHDGASAPVMFSFSAAVNFVLFPFVLDADRLKITCSICHSAEFLFLSLKQFNSAIK